MLSPSEILAIGLRYASMAQTAEDACVDRLVDMAADEALRGMDMAEAQRMGGRVPGVIVGQLARTPVATPSMVARSVSDGLAASLADDAAALGIDPEELARRLSGGATGANAVTDAVMRAIRRDNLAMAEDARRTWQGAVSEWVPRAARGEVSYEAAVEGMVRDMSARGVRVVDYASGVRTRADVAARRHVQTLVAQSCAARSLEAAATIGDGLVFVSSHIGARPEHREWQGRAYSVAGRKVIDGTVYEDLAEATGYGTVTGLCGANCRHSFGPWLHGTAPRYSPTPDEDMGLDPDEVYGATSRQRANERRIRDAKREARALQRAGADDTAPRMRLYRAQSDQRRLVRESPWMRRRAEREQVYGDRARVYGLKGVPSARERVRKLLGSGVGGVAGEPMEKIATIDMTNRDMVKATVEWFKETAVKQEVEHAFVLQADGTVLHSKGTTNAVSLEGADLAGAIVVHNHPSESLEPGSFGWDDMAQLIQHPDIAELWAVSEGRWYLTHTPSGLSEMLYNEAYRSCIFKAAADSKHEIMKWLGEHGYVTYRWGDL